MSARYRWLRAGDLNAFFGLALDNLSNLLILWGILARLFRFPPDLVLHRMIPGTAIGVLVGDRIYTWMAFRLARRTGRDDVTAMPLGIDTASLFGLRGQGRREADLTSTKVRPALPQIMQGTWIVMSDQDAGLRANRSEGHLRHQS